MDLSMIIGWVVAIILIINGITADKLMNFWDIPSILITVGGTLAAIVASYPFRILKEVPKHIAICFRGNKKYSVPQAVDSIVDLALIARQSGLLALEERAEDLKEPFFKQAVLIGTLVGLINMLKGMNLSGSGGSSTLGQDMSVALVTTFYGTILSNVFFHPITQKLSLRDAEEILYCQTIIEGVIAIQSGENPKVIRERLLASLAQKQQSKILARVGLNSSHGATEGEK